MSCHNNEVVRNLIEDIKQARKAKIDLILENVLKYENLYVPLNNIGSLEIYECRDFYISSFNKIKTMSELTE